MQQDMKLRIFNTLSIQQIAVWICILALSPCVFANGPNQEFSRPINREFATNSNGMTAIYNKFGAVNVKTWNKNIVKIDIVILVNAKDQREAEKTFNRVKVNFANTAGYVKAETMIQEKSAW